MIGHGVEIVAVGLGQREMLRRRALLFFPIRLENLGLGRELNAFGRNTNAGHLLSIAWRLGLDELRPMGPRINGV